MRCRSVMKSQGANDEMYGLLFKELDNIHEFLIALLELLSLRTVHVYDALEHGCVNYIRHGHGQY